MTRAAPDVEEVLSERALSQWAQAISHVAGHYRVACSPGSIQANAPWFRGKSRTTALTQLARQAGLSFHAPDIDKTAFSQWRLPLVVELRDGQLLVIEHVNGEDAVDVFVIEEEGQRNRLTFSELLPEILYVAALRPLSALKDSRVDRYISRFKPDWMRELVLQDIRPYLPVMVAASMLGSRMIAPMANLCGVLARWQQVKAAKMGLDNIMQLPTETQHDDSLIHRDILHGHYLFENAQFRYHNDDQRIPLRLVRLEIMPGERIAILGRNGAGKSTLLQAMAGGLEMIQGDARLDNLSLSHIDMADLRRNIGFLSQNARLFFGTLRENLTLGAPHANDEQIFDALEVSGGAVFVRRLAKGLDHPIMEGGNGLSGGQRQSLLLARMLLRSPNIVLLDEPSASLDEHTEREFIQRLHQWLGNRTLVVATHRVPILELVERVVVLKEGQLVMDAPKAQALNADRMQSHRREWKNENQSA
ncbi:ATP-binding cassette domain-containing protein [Salmonella enterica]|uniref:ATP-binding cassette domain-containing protein n=1 Tax=Salmonella enterica TaxID=28901 RepID=A0A722E9N3_SALER|nr:ATP-binding cassette domain-containing protein [Salmonella enterica]EDR4463467.1 ATP-binding cassette domain-containing protein [Salmonella enterica subsp. enterica serovar Albany]QPJ80808.1 ATP-binding cassette domain-containing protein [Salmonella enterica subsp. enterica serovar Albany]